MIVRHWDGTCTGPAVADQAWPPNDVATILTPGKNFNAGGDDEDLSLGMSRPQETTERARAPADCVFALRMVGGEPGGVRFFRKTCKKGRCSLIPWEMFWRSVAISCKKLSGRPEGWCLLTLSNAVRWRNLAMVDWISGARHGANPANVQVSPGSQHELACVWACLQRRVLVACGCGRRVSTWVCTHVFTDAGACHSLSSNRC